MIDESEIKAGTVISLGCDASPTLVKAVDGDVAHIVALRFGEPFGHPAPFPLKWLARVAVKVIAVEAKEKRC